MIKKPMPKMPKKPSLGMGKTYAPKKPTSRMGKVQVVGHDSRQDHARKMFAKHGDKETREYACGGAIEKSKGGGSLLGKMTSGLRKKEGGAMTTKAACGGTASGMKKAKAVKAIVSKKREGFAIGGVGKIRHEQSTKEGKPMKTKPSVRNHLV